MDPSSVPALVLDRERVVPPYRFVRDKVLLLLQYLFAGAVCIDRCERMAPLQASAGRIVNSEPQTVTTGRAGHTTGRRSLEGQVSV